MLSSPRLFTYIIPKIIITDTMRFRIQIYQKIHDYVELQFNL